MFFAHLYILTIHHAICKTRGLDSTEPRSNVVSVPQPCRGVGQVINLEASRGYEEKQFVQQHATARKKRSFLSTFSNYSSLMLPNTMPIILRLSKHSRSRSFPSPETKFQTFLELS